ncbi:MAG: glycosyltransferase family 4 protein, partial [Anaerolineae bacterium]
RLFNYGTWSATAFWGGLWSGKPDVIFSYSPPLPLGVSVWLLSRLWRVPWVLRVEDLYPDAAIAAGVLRNPAAIRFFAWLERFLYRRADHISLISEGFRRNLLAKEVLPDKLSVTPVWADPEIVRPLPKDNPFRRQHGLDGAFVVMYAGALGHTSALEDVLDTAMLLQDMPDQDPSAPPVRFVIVGEGVKKDALIQEARLRGLDNVLFLPFQPRERFAEMLASADASLVTLNAQSSSFSLPSKTFNIMASARPILAITPPDSEIAALVAAGQCGVNLPPGQPREVAQMIRNWQRDEARLQQMGQNGRSMLESQFSRDRCIGSFAKLLTQTVHERNHLASSQA